jgi:hypothetical protein
MHQILVQNDSDMSSAFGDAMGGLLTVVAQSAVLTLSVPPNAATKGVKILNIYHKEHIKRETLQRRLLLHGEG